MMKKTVASLGIAAAASAGALLLTGSPASAQTTASARTVAYAQQADHHADHRGHGRIHHWHHDGDYYGYYGHHHHSWSRHWNRDYDDTRIEISNTNVSISD
jgi:hypothetical protein